MNSFEQGGFTYDDLQEGVESFAYPERSIADGITIGNENPFDGIPEGEDVIAGLENSGVIIEPYNEFFSNGKAPELTAR